MKPDDDALPPASGGANDPAAFFRQLGEQTSKVLTAAEEAAREIRDQARRDAAGVLADARMQAEELARAAAAERRIAEEELRRFREARAILANQIEDVRRRLEEIVLRLRTPVDAPDTAPAKPHTRQGRTPAAATAAEESRPPPPPPPPSAPRSPALEAAEVVPAPGPEQDLQGMVVAPVATVPPGVPLAEASGGSSAEGDLAGQRRAEERREAPVPSPPAAPVPERAAAVVGEAAAMARAPELAPQRPTPKMPDAVQERLDAAPDTAPPAQTSASPAHPASTSASPAPPASASALPALGASRPPVPPASAANGGNPTVAPNATLGLPDFEPSDMEPSAGEPQVDVDEDLPTGSRHPEVFRRRVEALGDIPLAAARSLKRLLQEDQNDLLDRIRRSRGRGSFEQDILPADVQLDRFGDGMRIVLEPAFLRGRSLGGAPNIGESPDPVGSLVAKQVVAPLRRDLARMIEPRLAAGDTLATVSERAGDVYRVWKGVRTELLGEGLAYAAFHHGLLEAWREGHVGGKRWVMSPDEADCPKDICRTNEAAGLVGLDASFPSGHLVPPAHGACSCTVIAPAR